MKHNEKCETVEVDGVIYNKGEEPKEKKKPGRKPIKKAE
jgi:hypothetical protein